MGESLLRLYEPSECRADGYPELWPEVNQKVVTSAGHRCIRCLHPYRKGEHGRGEWSPCDEQCVHGGPVRVWVEVEGEGPESADWWETTALVPVGKIVADSKQVHEATWRILTVHHLQPGHDHKRDCRWWNLLALCQRCHLQIQNKVDPQRPYPWEHSPWFRPYAAGFYAWRYGAVEIDRNDEAAIEEWLRAGRFEDSVERMPL